MNKSFPLLRSLILLALFCATWLQSGPACAQGWVDGETLQARLVSGSNGIGSSGSVPVGLQVRPHPGWKIYWRTPGDSGLPPFLDWGMSENFSMARMSWPAPERFVYKGLQSYGYIDEVLFPIAVRPMRTDQAMVLTPRADFITCKTICMPESLNLSLTIPVGPKSPSVFAGLIDTWRAKLPDAGEHSGLAISNAHLDITAVPPILTVDAVARAPFDKPDLFVEFKPYLSAAPPSITYSDDRHRAHMSLTTPNATVDQIGQKVVMTLVDGPRAMETTVMIDQPGDPAKRTGRSLPLVLLLALIGGAILNLMPCVLPVLSLKLVSVVSHGGSTPEAVRAGFIASALGILFSFLVLATGTIILKKAGVAVGWGMHFQQPAFLVFMSAVLILFALNLFGLFEIRLPRFLMDAPGCVKTDNSSLAGHFVTGAFATLLATPCSAPFLGTATGFALTRGVIEIVAIFLTLGLGMSLPWLIVAIRPDLATKLPKPGPWMLWLKRAMGVCLMATALWLTAVLSVQAGAARAWIAFLLIMAGSASATVAIRQIGRTRQRFVIGAGVALVLAFFVAGGGHIGKLEIKTGWVAFDPVAIPAYVDAGKVVFVDVTADWCLTCQANKALVTGRGAVAERLASPDVVAMRADWTHRDSHIYAFITRHGRFGIPVDVVFGPGARDGILLPEILTTGRTLKAIETAKMSDE